MSTIKLRKVGGSVMAAIPPHLLREMHLEAGEDVVVERTGDALTLRKAAPKGRVGVRQRLAMCDFQGAATAQRKTEDEAWDRSPPFGREEI